MADWGYTVNKPRSIDMNVNDLAIARFIIASEPILQACIGCGNCTATCTAGALTQFNIRKLQTLMRRGEYAGVKRELGKCMLCGKCRMVCPRGINGRKMIVAMKRCLTE